MNYKLNLGAWNNVFAVPAVVVDDYIKLAGGNNLKILLFMLRNAGNETTPELIIEKTGVKCDDVEDALLFWEQMGLLAVHESTVTPLESEKLADTAAVKIAANIQKVNSIRKPYYNPSDIARVVCEDKSIEFLFNECERIYGKPLSNSQRQTLMIIIEDIGIPAECALMLVEYCHTEKKHPAYMKKIAEDWYTREINTAVLAEEEIITLKRLNNLENNLKKLFEMKSKFSDKHKNFIKNWSLWGFNEEMIDEAYQITLNSIGEMSLDYMNVVIEKWEQNNIKTKEQLKKSQSEFKEANKKEKFSNSSLDMDKISILINEKYKVEI